MVRMNTRTSIPHPDRPSGPITLADAWQRPRATPVLWDSAAAMLGVVLTRFGQPADIARQGGAPRSWLRMVNLWLRPVERLVRMLLICRAATYLLMTAEGARLLRESPKPPLPPSRAAPEPAPPRRPPAHTSIPYPGLATLARHWRPEPAPQPVSPPRDQPAGDPADTSLWVCRFSVLTRAPEEGAEQTVSPPLTLAGQGVRRLSPPEAPTGPGPSTLALARRIEALARVLRNPGPAIRRLARHIARLPTGVLGVPESAFHPPKRWEQGRFETVEAARLTDKATCMLERVAAHPNTS